MIEDLVEKLRRETKFGAARLAAVLKADHGIVVAPVTVHRIMVRRGINRVADLDPPTGDQMRRALTAGWVSPSQCASSVCDTSYLPKRARTSLLTIATSGPPARAGN